MPSPTATPRAGRPGLTRERIVTAAVELADAGGLDAVTMRAVANRFGVTPMSLYHHVRTKDAILDAMTDALFGEVPLPVLDGDDWRAAVRSAGSGLRSVLLRHRWGIRLVESRSAPGAETLRHHDTVLGYFRGGGFSVAATGMAIALLDSYVYGFVLQEINLPFEDGVAPSELADEILAGVAPGAYPHLAELAMTLVAEPDYAFGGQFDEGLDLVLDALAALAAR